MYIPLTSKLSTNLTWIDGEVFIDLYHLMDFPRGSDSKESAYNAGDTGLIPGSGRSLGECHRNPLQYSCLGNSMGYSPRGCRVGHDWATNSFTLTFVPLNGNIYLCNTRNIHIFAYWMLPQTPQEILLNIQNITTEIKYYLSEIKKKIWTWKNHLAPGVSEKGLKTWRKCKILLECLRYHNKEWGRK